MNTQHRVDFSETVSTVTSGDSRVAVTQTVFDTAHVDINDRHSLDFWSTRIGISDQQLLRAARAVGTAIVDIERFLAGKHRRR